MKNTLIFLGVVLVIKFIVKELSKSKDVKGEIDNHINNTTEDKIEKGYPTPNTQSLHINSKQDQPISNHYFTDEQIIKFSEDNDPENHYKLIYTKNMFVESHHELNLSLFERELTAKMVNDAYEKVLDEHMDKIRKGIPDVFNLNDKKEARDYLLNKLNKEVKD